MAAVEFTSLEELVGLISNSRAVELFDDNGDGVIADSETAVANALASANDAVASILFLKGFSADQLEQGLKDDASIRRYATAIFAQYGGERRTEFLSQDGKGRYEGIGKRARDNLAAFARAELRSRTEQDVGANPIALGDASAGCPAFLVARDPRYPGSRDRGF